MNVIGVNPTSDKRWEILISQKKSSIFHTPEWMSVIAETYNLEPCAAIVVDTDGNPLAGISYFVINSIRGSKVVSMPFSDHCDPIVSEPSHY